MTIGLAPFAVSGSQRRQRSLPAVSLPQLQCSLLRASWGWPARDCARGAAHTKHATAMQLQLRLLHTCASSIVRLQNPRR